MNLFGEHGTEAVADIFLISAALFGLLTFFEKRFHPDTYVVIVTIYGVLNVAGNVILIVSDIEHHDWTLIPLWIFFIVIVSWYVYITWKRWKNRKKVLQAIGAKSKALRDALVRRMREAQPEGAR